MVSLYIYHTSTNVQVCNGMLLSRKKGRALAMYNLDGVTEYHAK